MAGCCFTLDIADTAIFLTIRRIIAGAVRGIETAFHQLILLGVSLGFDGIAAVAAVFGAGVAELKQKQQGENRFKQIVHGSG